MMVSPLETVSPPEAPSSPFAAKTEAGMSWSTIANTNTRDKSDLHIVFITSLSFY